MAYTLGQHLVFIDSFQLMGSSLDRLVNNLPEGAFKHTAKVFQGEKLTLMTKTKRLPLRLYV